MIDLDPGQLETVAAILADLVPFAEVRAFGSRVKGTATAHSDLDLAIVATAPLPLATLGNLLEAFQESPLPFTVDIVDCHAITPEFRQLIDRQFVVVQIGGDPD